MLNSEKVWENDEKEYQWEITRKSTKIWQISQIVLESWESMRKYDKSWESVKKVRK